MEQTSSATAVSVRNLRKRFGPTQALAGVDLDIQSAAINALIGGNGSGKSTGIKILGGVEQADAGSISFGDEEIDARRMNPALARAHGIRVIHQQGSTFGSLSVEENFAAGVYPTARGLGRVDWKQLRRRTVAALEEFGVDLSPREIVGDLRPGKRQLLAIVRALDSLPDRGAGILILDEPTASLAVSEVERLQTMLGMLVRAGHSILYVTHRLEELPGFAERVTVLRDGLVARILARHEITHDALVASLLEGLRQPSAQAASNTAGSDSSVRLRVAGVKGGPVARADLTVRAGEIVGLAGLAGSGRSSLLQMIFGVSRPTNGEIDLDGKRIHWRGGRPHAGIGYVPEDRLGEAAFSTLSIRENVLAPSTGRFWSRGRFRRRAERAFTDDLTRRYTVRGVASDQTQFKNLSGGNQQKVVLARWIAVEPGLLLLDEPTQGVDIAARAEVHAHVRAAARSGVAVLVASSDATELTTLCERVIVLWRGQTVAELTGAELDSEAVERYVQAGNTQLETA